MTTSALRHAPRRVGTIVAVTATFVALGTTAQAAEPAPGDPCYPAACIDNGTIQLAVNPTGELNTSDGTGSEAGLGDTGLHYIPTGNDGTSPGCLCEGWGVADPDSGVWGAASQDEYGDGGANLTVESFDATETTATSVVTVGDPADPTFRVTHTFAPSTATSNLYQVTVRIENLTDQTINTVKYRRTMDWDIEPTEFNELVTIATGDATAIVHASDDGFADPNPLEPDSPIVATGDQVDSGPDDHGALFDFEFGPLTPGNFIEFVIFYGAAASEAEAIAALTAVGAEAYSFGQTSDGGSTGAPNTFIFAFGKVGGAPIFGPPPTTPTPEAPVVTQVLAPVKAPVTGVLPDTGASTDLSTVAWAFGLILAGGAALVLGRRRVVTD